MGHWSRCTRAHATQAPWAVRWLACACRWSHALGERPALTGAVCWCVQVGVDSVKAVLDVLQMGAARRTTAATLMNSTSSRSHAVFTVTVESTPMGASDGDGADDGGSDGGAAGTVDAAGSGAWCTGVGPHTRVCLPASSCDVQCARAVLWQGAGWKTMGSRLRAAWCPSSRSWTLLAVSA